MTDGLICAMSSFTAYSTFTPTTSSTMTSNQAISFWASVIGRTWYTLLILDYQRNFGTPIHASTFPIMMVLVSWEHQPSHPLTVTWAWSLEGEMTWSLSLTYYFTFFGVFYCGRA